MKIKVQRYDILCKAVIHSYRNVERYLQLFFIQSKQEASTHCQVKRLFLDIKLPYLIVRFNIPIHSLRKEIKAKSCSDIQVLINTKLCNTLC